MFKLNDLYVIKCSNELNRLVIYQNDLSNASAEGASVKKNYENNFKHVKLFFDDLYIDCLITKEREKVTRVPRDHPQYLTDICYVLCIELVLGFSTDRPETFWNRLYLY